MDSIFINTSVPDCMTGSGTSLIIISRNPVSSTAIIKSIIKDLAQEIPPSLISAKFHNTLAQVIFSVAERARRDYGIDTVVFVGGVFLNKKLLHRATSLLEQKKFRVLRTINYSPNDESISIGQIAYGLNKLKTIENLKK